jgi:thymidylate synthase
VTYNFFKDAIADVVHRFKRDCYDVHTSTWQAMPIHHRPEAAMKELLNVSFSVRVGNRTPDILAKAVEANMPWAEDHFKERVCGQPINPGTEWKNWPYAHKAAESLDENGKFNHNYMERYWPRNAGMLKEPTHSLEDHERQYFLQGSTRGPNFGIYHEFGDLDDLIKLMGRDPLTRQAYLPIFFPEDTGAVHKGRVPCTLGYHFIMRQDELHMVYYLRSCDLVRHFRDDIYLSVRLQMWVLEQLRERFGGRWLTVKPGVFTMHITSLHCFVNDFRSL